MRTIINIQDELAERVIESAIRWNRRTVHRLGNETTFGHFWRTKAAARRAAKRQFAAFGCYSADQIETMIADALDVAELTMIERNQ